MKNIFPFIVFLLFAITIKAQDSKVLPDPLFLKKVQGTWMNTRPGTYWNKVVISGNNITTYAASPGKGRWNDEREGRNEIIHFDIVDSYKVVKKGYSDYDGKAYTSVYSIIRTRSSGNYNVNGNTGPFFSMSQSGKLEQYGISNGDYDRNKHPDEPTIIYQKVLSNYNPWK
jgi:hypothetical protein